MSRLQLTGWILKHLDSAGLKGNDMTTKQCFDIPWLLIQADRAAKGTQTILAGLFGRQLDGRAPSPRLGKGAYVPLTRRWGKNVSPEERARIEAEDGTAAKLASGEIIEDEAGRRYEKIADDVEEVRI